MIKTEKRVRPIQPYMKTDTINYREEDYLQHGISHFYTFECREHQVLRIVPDGCMDLVFVYTREGMTSYVRGTTTEFRKQILSGIRQVFGVKFLPGVHPALIKVHMGEMPDRYTEMEDVLKGNKKWLSDMGKRMDFEQCIKVFLQAYLMAENKAEMPYGKRAIAMTIKGLIYATDGKIKIGDIAGQTGYSERYVHKVFRKEMGFSPKIFCKIIQFQRILEYLEDSEPDKIVDIAIEYGYYDQPQLNRDFRRYAGMTPKRYARWMCLRD